jgi:hypothetical protein
MHAVMRAATPAFAVVCIQSFRMLENIALSPLCEINPRNSCP